MTTEKQLSIKQAPPVVRTAPPGSLNVYSVYEHELEELRVGSPTSLFLNFALFLLPTGLTLIITLLTTDIPNDRLFTVFVCVAVITLVSGVILLSMWWKQHSAKSNVFDRIKNRMPPPEGIQEN